MSDYEYKPYKAPLYASLDAPAGEFHHLLGELRRKYGNTEIMEKYEDLRDDEKANTRKKNPHVGGVGMSPQELDVKMTGWYSIMNESIKNKLLENGGE